SPWQLPPAHDSKCSRNLLLADLLQISSGHSPQSAQSSQQPFRGQIQGSRSAGPQIPASEMNGGGPGALAPPPPVPGVPMVMPFPNPYFWSLAAATQVPQMGSY
ncbi:unnamed protein product, partial [Polarella glacialis]